MTSPSSSRVLAFLPSDHSERAVQEFEQKLTYATDPSDVAADLEEGVTGFVVVDARTREAYERGHVPGAISLPHRQMNEATTAHLSRGLVYVTYCDGIGCNASTKGALNLSRLGFRAKEMLGGLDWWIRDGYAVETGPGAAPASSARISCGC